MNEQVLDSTSGSIYSSIYRAVDRLNQTRDGAPLTKNPGTSLFGENGQLDSLGLINLIVAVEEQIEDDFGTPITLADDRALSQEMSPFRTFESLAGYIQLLLKEKTQ